MEVHKTILDVIGNTPLVRLNKVSQGLKPTILAKLENLNPGGSVKDRIGVAMIEEAERKGLLRPGGTFVGVTTTFAPYARRIARFSSLILSGMTKIIL